ncbi:alpha/beta hydrolase family protein [Chitinophaga barathri]|nr:alpha/beta hydrolase [Chitinophaga barathri]
MKLSTLCLLFLFLCHGAFAQEAKPAVEYISEDVTFPNKVDSITLAGTFSFPQTNGKFPAVIIISGSGGQNRDGLMLGHKPYQVIADHLTKNGFAVLRYDDRGIGASTGVMKGADIADFTRDAKAALVYLRSRKEVDTKKTGIIGHSEGGAIGLAVAAEDPSLGFLVSMAGPGVDGVQMILAQTEAIYRNMGMKDSMVRIKVAEQRAMVTAIAEEPDTAKLKARIAENAQIQYAANPSLKPSVTEDNYTKMLVNAYMVPEYLSIIRFDPAKYYPSVKCPVLAMNGAKDIQVISSVNLAGWQKGIRGVTIKELPGLNHLFQECRTCSVQEYKTITQTISPAALDELTSWARQITGLQK